MFEVLHRPPSPPLRCVCVSVNLSSLSLSLAATAAAVCAEKERRSAERPPLRPSQKRPTRLLRLSASAFASASASPPPSLPQCQQRCRRDVASRKALFTRAHPTNTQISFCATGQCNPSAANVGFFLPSANSGGTLANSAQARWPGGRPPAASHLQNVLQVHPHLPVSFAAAAGQVSSGEHVLSVGPGPAGCL